MSGFNGELLRTKISTWVQEDISTSELKDDRDDTLPIQGNQFEWQWISHQKL